MAIAKLTPEAWDKITVNSDFEVKFLTGIQDMKLETNEVTKKNPMYYVKKISYEMWEDNSPGKMPFSKFYGIGTVHEIDGAMWTVESVDKDIVWQAYKIIFTKLVPGTASAETIKIDPIVNFTKEPGHFNDVGKWVKDVVSTPPTNREKIFHELTEGIAS